LLDDPLRAKRIALAARDRAHRDHTYEQRARQLLACCGWSQSEIMS
jgi:spore maturation protein CgeB